VKCCKGRHENQKRKRKEMEKKRSITAKPLGIKPYASSVKVALAVSNKKISRKMVFHRREPPWMLFKDNEVTHSLAHSMNALVAISFSFLLFDLLSK
jgi:hypothetical protein